MTSEAKIESFDPSLGEGEKENTVPCGSEQLVQKLPISHKKRYRSAEGNYLAAAGTVQEADLAESNFIEARGRITASNGNVNGPGNKLDGARLMSFDAETGIILIRVDCTQVPEFWLELELPFAQLGKFVEQQAANNDESSN